MSRSAADTARTQARFDAIRRAGPARYVLRHGLAIGVGIAVLATCYELVRGSHLIPSPVGSFLLWLASKLIVGCGIGFGLAAMSWWSRFEGRDAPAPGGEG